ncbi:MAG: hypothetical protein NVS9B8_17170 [Candidatus Limnocylindrales bacterium]
MCFDFDSRPPIAPIAGGALDSTELTLEAEARNRFRARARAAYPAAESASDFGASLGCTGVDGR